MAVVIVRDRFGAGSFRALGGDGAGGCGRSHFWFVVWLLSLRCGLTVVRGEGELLAGLGRPLAPLPRDRAALMGLGSKISVAVWAVLCLGHHLWAGNARCNRTDLNSRKCLLHILEASSNLARPKQRWKKQ